MCVHLSYCRLLQWRTISITFRHVARCVLNRCAHRMTPIYHIAYIIEREQELKRTNERWSAEVCDFCPSGSLWHGRSPSTCVRPVCAAQCIAHCAQDGVTIVDCTVQYWSYGTNLTTQRLLPVPLRFLVLHSTCISTVGSLYAYYRYVHRNRALLVNGTGILLSFIHTRSSKVQSTSTVDSFKRARVQDKPKEILATRGWKKYIGTVTGTSILV